MIKNISNYYYLLHLLILSSLLLFSGSTAFGDTGFISSRYGTLQNKYEKVTEKIKRIHSNSSEVNEISQEFVSIAENNLRLVTEYESAKALCKNNEDEFKEKVRLRGNTLSQRVIRYEKKIIKECYEDFAFITVNLDLINADFSKLAKKVTELKDVAEAQKRSVSTLTKNLNILTGMLASEKLNMANKLKSLDIKIDDFTK